MVAAVKRQTHRNPLQTSLGLFHQAVKAAEPEFVEQLISKGANVNEPTAFGTTPLMMAAAEGHLRIAQLLLAHGARINDVRADGFSPLTFAVFFGHQEIVNELIARGADIHVQSRSGTSLQRWAEARALFDILDLLESVESESVDVTTLISTQEPIAEPFVPSLSESIPQIEPPPVFQPEAISDIELAPVFQAEAIAEAQAEPILQEEATPELQPASISRPEPVAELQPLPLVQEHAISDMGTAAIYQEKPIAEVQPASITPQVDSRSMTAWNTVDVDPGEGIRRLTPLREWEEQAEPETPLQAAAPFSPFSALIDRMTSRWTHSAAIVLAVFVLFGGLTFFALKTRIWNHPPTTKTMADQSTSMSSSQPLPVQSQPPTVSTEGLPGSSIQQSSSATNSNDSKTEDAPLTITAETQPSDVLEATGSNAQSPRAISQHTTGVSRAWRRNKRSERVYSSDAVNPSSEPEAAPVTIVSKPASPPAPAVTAPENGRVLSAPTPDNPRKRRVIQWP